jgi:hypothetical protein
MHQSKRVIRRYLPAGFVVATNVWIYYACGAIEWSFDDVEAVGITRPWRIMPDVAYLSGVNCTPSRMCWWTSTVGSIWDGQLYDEILLVIQEGEDEVKFVLVRKWPQCMVAKLLGFQTERTVIHGEKAHTIQISYLYNSDIRPSR